MEEQKKSKEVKMEPVKSGDTENSQEKIPYEKLAEITNSLYNENQQLRQSLQQAAETLKSINRLSYLFKVVELANKNATYSFTPEFVTMCLSEIEELMTPPVEEEHEEDKEAN